MTSPTTSADAVKVLQQAIADFHKNPTIVYIRLTLAECDNILAALTQHAEAGAVARAVAWEVRDNHGRVVEVTNSAQRRDAMLQTINGTLPTWTARPLIYGDHPAQPASQEGEEWMQRIGPADHVAVITETKYGPAIWFNTEAAMSKFSEWPFPAQPASHQGAIGEIVARPYGYGVEWLVSPAPAIGTKLYESPQAHPTGDKVRVTDAMVERARSAYKSKKRYYTGDYPEGAIRSIADMNRNDDDAWHDAIAAALDQEKGR